MRSISVGWRDMSSTYDDKMSVTPSSSGTGFTFHTTSVDKAVDRLRPVQQSPLTLNLGAKKLEMERIDRMNRVLARKLIEVTCTP